MMWQSQRIFYALFIVAYAFAADTSNLRGRKLQEVTESFEVIDDTFVRDNGPDRNYNSVTNLGVAYGATNNERITFVKFPISFDLQNAISISSAKLRMRVNQAPTGADSMIINFYPVDTEDWSESVITWNNRPTFDNTVPPITSYTITASDDSTWLEFDITSALIAAVEALKNSVSIAIEPNRPGDSSSLVMKFDSKEDLNNIPLMNVAYIPSEGTAPPTSSPSPFPTIDYSQPEYAQLVSLDGVGSLQYVQYANEINVVQGSTANPAAINTVPDFSSVGYKGGGVPIPFVEVKQTLSPTSGDRRADIQAAIDAVAALDLDVDGLRGAILLEAGTYEVSYPGVNVYDSGIVIRGQGQGEVGGTKIIYTSTVSDSYAITLGFPNGGLNSIEPNGETYAITDSYVAVGSKTITITDASSFAAGDRIVIQLLPNDAWILHMSDMSQYGWTPGSYQVRWRRQVTAVNGNELTLDAPIVHAIEAVYGGAEIYRYEVTYNFVDVEIQNVGIENIRIESTFASDIDENHGKHAVRVQRVSNGWIRQLTSQYFWSGAVYLRRYSHSMTVEDTASLDPKGTLAGGRRYGFVIDDGDMHFIQRCYVRDGRHDYATSSRTSGPNVFVDSLSVDSHNDIGPHERFSTGQLYDNVKTTMNSADLIENGGNDNGGEMNVQNRGSSGSGHGWAGVEIMFWNCEAKRWRCHAPNGGMSWAIGMIGEKGGFLDNRIPEPDGIIQSHGAHVTPRSLYYTQLLERMGANALRSVVLPAQKTGDIWTELSSWMGNGLFGDAVVAWLDEDAVPVTTGKWLDIGGMVRDLNLLGNSPSYSWTVFAGPGNVSFSDSSILTTTVLFDAPGMYTLELLVSDGSTNKKATLDVIVEEGTSYPTSSKSPSAMPTKMPSLRPSFMPSAALSHEPSHGPTSSPSVFPTVSSTECNNNGSCDLGESCDTCPGDCPSGNNPGALCGNGICETADGEDCLSCPADCNGQQSGKPSGRYCCGNGFSGENPVTCDDSKCGGPAACTSVLAPPGSSFCCGNGICKFGESGSTCALDCPSTPAPSSPPGTPTPTTGLPQPTATPESCGAAGDPCSSNSNCCSNNCKGNNTCK